MYIRYRLSLLRCKIIKYLVGFIPKDKDLIIFSAWFGEKYADNTMYLFEYMLHRSNHRLYWFTKNYNVYQQLRQNNIPVLYSKTIKAKWKQSRAIMLLSTVQTFDFNSLYLNKCIFLDLDHGFPGKPVGLAQPTVDERWKTYYYLNLKGINFYQTASSKFVVDYLSPCYDVTYSHYIFANKPRIDVLFDKDLQEGKNILIDKLRQKSRIITYLPTHRSCGRVQMKLTDIFNLSEIQRLCEANNFFFVIKKHFYHRNEEENLSIYNNIIDVTNINIDTQVLLAQSDVLITDFSSCYNDYLALNRPIIFYAYDYDDYMLHERDYYWKYDKIKAGYTTKNKEEFISALENISKDWSDSKHAEGRTEMRRMYFDDDVEMGTSREKLAEIIEKLIMGTYVAFDWEGKKISTK